MRLFVTIILCMLTVWNSAYFVVFANDSVHEPSVSLVPASTQQRRMWCNKDYNSADYVYEPWYLSYWGRVHHLRFASNEIIQQKIKKAVIKFDARARESEKTVYLATIVLSDTSALKVESDLTALTSKNKITETKATTLEDKLMLDTDGYYLQEVASSVCAYGKFTASEDTTDEDIYSNAG